MEKFPSITKQKQQVKALTHRKLKALLDFSNDNILNVNESYIKNTTYHDKELEKRELSLNLRRLRVEYDKQRLRAVSQENRIRKLRAPTGILKNSKFSDESLANSKFIDSSRHSQYSVSFKSPKLSDTFKEAKLQNSYAKHSKMIDKISKFNEDSLSFLIESAKTKFELEKANRQSYKHILNRIRKTNIFLREKVLNLEDELDSTKLVFKHNHDTYVKTKEKKATAKLGLKRLKRITKRYKKVREKDLELISAEIYELEMEKERKKALRNEQIHRMENNLIHEQSQKSEAVRNRLLLTKLWHNFVAKRFEKEHRKWQHIEFAFSRIKSHTGISDLDEIVQKFLTKEQNLSRLMESTRNKSCELESCKDKIQRIQEAVKVLELSQEPSQELKGISEEKELLMLTVAKDKEKLRKISLIYSKLLTWLGKISGISSDSLREHILTIKQNVRIR